jgi:hypothetical protein
VITAIQCSESSGSWNAELICDVTMKFMVSNRNNVEILTRRIDVNQTRSFQNSMVFQSITEQQSNFETVRVASEHS